MFRGLTKILLGHEHCFCSASGSHPEQRPLQSTCLGYPSSTSERRNAACNVEFAHPFNCNHLYSAVPLLFLSEASGQKWHKTLSSFHLCGDDFNGGSSTQFLHRNASTVHVSHRPYCGYSLIVTPVDPYIRYGILSLLIGVIASLR